MSIIGRRPLKVAGGLLIVLATGAGLVAWYVSLWSQDADPEFDASVSSPAMGDPGPIVLFDRGHFNAHGLETTYAPFAALLRSDGYRLSESTSRIRAETLEGVEILVIVNARGSNESGRRGEPAFERFEIEAVVEWVDAGGSLLLVADHAPYGSAASELAESFGVEMGNSDTIDPEYHDAVTGNQGFLVFSESNGLLSSHPIIKGRNKREHVAKVLTFNGQSLQPPAESTSLLTLSDQAFDKVPDGSERSARGRAQGLAVESGWDESSCWPKPRCSPRKSLGCRFRIRSLQG